MPAEPTKGGTKVHFDAVVEEYGVYLRNLIARLCPSDLGIEYSDVEQDARIRLWRAIESGKEIKDLASYIYRIAATTTIDAIRRVKARREQQLGVAEEQAGDEVTMTLPAPPECSPENITERRQLSAAIRRAVDRLNENRRKVVLMHVEGFSLDEIAGLTGWTLPKTRHLVYRGLADLRRELSGEGIDGEGY
jgi:RNA polymerase sigma-70 factor (ECF subfamily)